MPTKKHSIKLVSASGLITLPDTFENLKTLKINKFQYRFINTDQYVLTLHFLTFEQNTHFDGISTYPYTYCLYNDGNANRLYNLDYTNSNYQDVVLEYGRNISQIQYSIKCDNLDLADISQSNSVLLEIEYGNSI